MDMGRPSSTNVIAIYNVPFVILYSSIILAAAGVGGVVAFTGEPIAAYLERKLEMVPLVLILIVGLAYEIARCLIIFYNIAINGGRALFVFKDKIVFISKYFSSIPIAQIVSVVPGKKKVVRIILSTGKSKKIYTSFLTPSDPKIVAQKIEALVQRVDTE